MIYELGKARIIFIAKKETTELKYANFFAWSSPVGPLRHLGITKSLDLHVLTILESTIYMIGGAYMVT